MKQMFSVFITALLTLIYTVSPAATRMIFWYPGEAGSQAEAQPILDAFAQLVSQQAGESLQAIYFNQEQAGEKYIQNQKPQFGILSYPTWLKWQKKHPESKVLLQVVPLHGKLNEQYLLVGKQTPRGNVLIYSSEPLDASFIHEQLFPQRNWQAQVTPQAHLLFKLKELADGKWNGFCLLTPREAQSFQALKNAWKQNLTFTQSSQAISTPRLIVFQEKEMMSREKWEKAFLTIDSAANAQEVLTELNLLRFVK